MILFLYYIFIFLQIISYYNLNFLNKIYLHFYWINLFVKRKFVNISSIEKFILVFYGDKGWFDRSNFGYFNKEEVKKYGIDNHPLISFFHYYNINFSFNFINIFKLKKLYRFFKNKKIINYRFSNFLILVYIYFDRFYNILETEYFKKENSNNFFKINFIFIYFNLYLRKNIRLKIFNLKYYYDWYCYNFNKNFIKQNINKKHVFSEKYEFFFLESENKKILHLFKVYFAYKKITKQSNFLKFDYYIYNFFKNTKKYKLVFFKNIKIKKNNLSFLLPTRFSETSLNKYINKYNVSKYSFFYIRKNKIFNKSRYSRNRQLYRTGVYWCLWLNIMIVYGLYFVFYRFTFNFGYLWFGVGFLIFSTLFSRIIKYKFYNLYFLINEFYNLYCWLGFIFKNFFINLDSFLEKTNFFWKNYLISHFFNFYYTLYQYFINLIIFLEKETDYGFVFLWKSYKQTHGISDDSYFKWKSKIHWIGEFIKAVRY